MKLLLKQTSLALLFGASSLLGFNTVNAQSGLNINLTDEDNSFTHGLTQGIYYVCQGTTLKIKGDGDDYVELIKWNGTGSYITPTTSNLETSDWISISDPVLYAVEIDETFNDVGRQYYSIIRKDVNGNLISVQSQVLEVIAEEFTGVDQGPMFYIENNYCSQGEIRITANSNARHEIEVSTDNVNWTEITSVPNEEATPIIDFDIAAMPFSGLFSSNQTYYIRKKALSACGGTAFTQTIFTGVDVNINNLYYTYGGDVTVMPNNLSSESGYTYSLEVSSPSGTVYLSQTSTNGLFTFDSSVLPAAGTYIGKVIANSNATNCSSLPETFYIYLSGTVIDGGGISGDFIPGVFKGTKGKVELFRTFRADKNVTLDRIEWNFGDRSNPVYLSPVSIASHVYSKSGTYDVSAKFYARNVSKGTLFTYIARHKVKVDVSTGEYTIIDPTNKREVVSNSIEAEELQNVSMYPNPTEGLLTVELEKEVVDGQIDIFNSLGAKVRSTQFMGKQTQVDLSELAKGMYIVTLKAENKTKSERIMIQ